MAMATGLYGANIRDALDTSALALDFLADTLKNALVTDTYTPVFETHWQYSDFSANEVSGTGYTALGTDPGVFTWAASAGFLTLDAPDTAWGPGATIGSIEGRILLDDTVASDPLIYAEDFTTTLSVTSGTFTIQEDANGIFRFNLT